MKKQIVYVTGNQMKVDVLNRFLDQNEFEVVAKKIDCPELQLDSIEEVAINSAKYASEYLKQAVLKNDSGLVIPALNGFPGPYSKYVEYTLKEEGILALLRGKTDRVAYYQDAYAYCEYGKEPVLFTCRTYGTIAEQASGDFGNYFDRIFIPAGKTLPMSHMKYDEFLDCINIDAVNELASYLKSKD